MRRCVLIVCASLSATAAAVWLAAQDAPPADLRLDTGTYVVTDPVEQARELTEDIEVLRTILAREIAALYTPGADGRARGLARTGLPFDPTKLLTESGGRGTAGPMGMEAMSGTGMTPGGMPGMMDTGYDEYYGEEDYDGMEASYGRPGRAAATPAPVQPLGTYIEGAGVVYQLDLPALREPAPADERLDPRNCRYLNSSEWLRTAMELRGELWQVDCRQCHAAASGTGSGMTLPGFGGGGSSPFSAGAGGVSQARPPRDVAAGPTREQLVSRLLALLAENGRHVRHLGDDERITVAVSIRPEQPQTPASPAGRSAPGGPGAAGGYPGMMGMGAARSAPADGSSRTAPGVSPGPAGDADLSDYGDSGAGGLPGGPTPSGGSPMGHSAARNPMAGGGGGRNPFDASRSAPGGGMGSAAGHGVGLTPDAGSEELAGDLHLRRNEPTEAAAAFERALLKSSLGRTQPVAGGGSPLSRVLSGDLGRPWKSNERRLYQKLLQSYVAAGNLDSARKLLANWPADEEPRESSTGRPQPPMRLPARLVVSATRGQLDAVASGKLSAEEFRQQARVSFFDPQAPQAGTQNEQGQVAVSGTVVLNGQPVGGGTVEFVPADGKGRPATARTDESGRFTLKLPRGEYNVGVKSVQNGVSRVPERYSAAARSGLRVEITEGRNDFMFELVTQ